MNLADMDRLTDVLQDIIECASQAPSDLCGEQREWYLPRLSRAMTTLGSIFPRQALDAMERSKDPYGDLLVKE